MSSTPMTAAQAPSVSARPRSRIGTLWIDSLSFSDAVDEIARLIESGEGGSVFTPNVDHIVLAETNAPFRSAYGRANLVLADGTPVLWASRLLRTPLPEKVSGADLMMPIARLAAKRGWRVYLLGGAPGVGERAADCLREDHLVNVVGVHAPAVTADGRIERVQEVLELIRASRPDVVFVAFGTPKQELWIGSMLEELRPAVAIGVGAGLDFLAGTARRAPKWVSTAGLEWLYRLAREPRRLARRYLLRDPAFLMIFWRALKTPRAQRVRD